MKLNTFIALGLGMPIIHGSYMFFQGLWPQLGVAIVLATVAISMLPPRNRQTLGGFLGKIGIHHNWLSEKLGITESHAVCILKDDVATGDGNITMLARELGYSVDYLVKLERNKS